MRSSIPWLVLSRKKVYYDFEGKRVRSFVVNPDRILRVEWVKNTNGNRTKSKVPIESMEIDEWILLSKSFLNEWMELKRSWKKVRDAVIKLGSPQLQPYIDKINELFLNITKLAQ